MLRPSFVVWRSEGQYYCREIERSTPEFLLLHRLPWNTDIQHRSYMLHSIWKSAVLTLQTKYKHRELLTEKDLLSCQ